MNAKTTSTKNVIRLVTAAVAVALTLTVVAAALPNITAQAAPASSTFRSRLAESAGAEKFAALDTNSVAAVAAPHTRTATPIAPPAPTVTRTSARKSTSAGSTSTGSAASAPVAASGDELAEAQSILAGLIGQHPILAGTTVSIGDAKGYQAISYYKSGRIVISATHTASLSRILNHEIWHVIDWRDNGVIDWGENVPPK